MTRWDRIVDVLFWVVLVLCLALVAAMYMALPAEGSAVESPLPTPTVRSGPCEAQIAIVPLPCGPEEMPAATSTPEVSAGSACVVDRPGTREPGPVCTPVVCAAGASCEPYETPAPLPAPTPTAQGCDCGMEEEPGQTRRLWMPFVTGVTTTAVSGPSAPAGE